MKRRGSEEESKAIFKRLEAQSEKALGAQPQEGGSEQDWAERWGRRLGLVIGYGLALFLLWHLYKSYVAG